MAAVTRSPGWKGSQASSSRLLILFGSEMLALMV